MPQPPERLKLLILGAHPDDAEFHAGGLATRYRQFGYKVKMVSVTNGDAGHHETFGPPLAEIRRAEATAAARVIGATYEIWDNHDGQLQPTLEVRRQVIRCIRSVAPDLILTHRTNDYHPDHRAVGQLVQDASYMVTVPSIERDVPILTRDPVVAYLPDRFTKPYPLAADVVVDVTDQFETIVDMLACHRSQVYEWLPFNTGTADTLPADETARRTWLAQWYAALVRPNTDRYRDALIATYGSKRGQAIQFAEVFEISEYASPLDADARRRLFPFLPEAD